MTSPQSGCGLHPPSMAQSSEHSSLQQQQLQLLHPKCAMPEASSSVIDTSDRRSTKSSDWRLQLQADSRQRIVNKIMDTLKRHLPFSGQEGYEELMNVAVRFEEKVYNAATSQSDYLRKISLKMLVMETKCSLNPPQLNINDLNLPDPVALRNQLVADLQCKFGKWMNNLGCEG